MRNAVLHDESLPCIFAPPHLSTHHTVRHDFERAKLGVRVDFELDLGDLLGRLDLQEIGGAHGISESPDAAA